MAFKEWVERKEDLRHMYYDLKMTTKEIGNIYGVSKTTISRNMIKLGFELRKIGTEDRINAKYDINEHFFDEINSEEKAYILGFVLTDGHVSKQQIIMFGIQYGDIDILYKINNALNSTYPIIEKPKENKVFLNFSSRLISSKLNEMGIYNNKSKNLNINKILEYVPENLEKHFLRGMVDGNRSIRYYKYDYLKKHQFHFGYTGLKNVVDYVYKKLNLHTKIIEEGNGIYTCTTKCVGDILDICSYLYDDSTIYLDRKYNAYMSIQDIFNEEFK